MKVVPPKSTPGNAAAMSSPRSSANRPGVSHSSAAPALGRGSPSTPADSADNDCEVEHWAAIAQAYIWRGDAGRSNLFRRTTLSQPPADQPEAARLPPQGWGLDCSIPLLEGGFVGALVEPWGGFGVAIRWLSVGFGGALVALCCRMRVALVEPWGGFTVALMSHYCRIPLPIPSQSPPKHMARMWL